MKTENRFNSKKTVILLHGLSRSTLSMQPMQRRLTTHGYNTINIGYPSNKKGFTELVDFLHNRLKEYDDNELYAVTHSMGGILLQQYTVSHPDNKISKAVMIAPPNQGSEIADKLSQYRWFQSLFGPTGSRLGTSPHDIPKQLTTPSFEFGVIAGNFPINPLGGLLINQESDGTVSVESTKKEGMKDFLVLPFSHTLIHQRRKTAKAVINFFEKGTFL